MVELSRDKKSDTWLITTIDSEGFHRQLNITDVDMSQLFMKYTVAKAEEYVHENKDFLTIPNKKRR